jgi:hypothetical protein
MDLPLLLLFIVLNVSTEFVLIYQPQPVLSEILELVRKKILVIHLLSQEIHIKGTERPAQVRQACSLFEQNEPWKKSQLIIRPS